MKNVGKNNADRFAITRKTRQTTGGKNGGYFFFVPPAVFNDIPEGKENILYKKKIINQREKWVVKRFKSNVRAVNVKLCQGFAFWSRRLPVKFDRCFCRIKYETVVLASIGARHLLDRYSTVVMDVKEARKIVALVNQMATGHKPPAPSISVYMLHRWRWNYY